MRYAILFIAILCTGSLYAVPVHAQLDFGTVFSLAIAPEYPEGRDSVRVTAHSSLVDLSTETLIWYVDGVETASGVGLSEIDVTAGPLGSNTRVEAVLSEGGFKRALAEAIIRPVAMDVLWESDSYTPPFYRGRALPSAGTNLLVEAKPYFRNTNGSNVPIEDIVFTWSKNGYAVAGVSGKGKNKVTLPSPSLYGSDSVSVKARTLDGVFAIEKSVRIPSTEPLLNLYEDHPLFGTLYHRALGEQTVIFGEETSFTAIPYFASALNPNDRSLQYEWSVGGTPIENSLTQPNTITINARGSSGNAFVELLLSHASNLFFRADGSWNVQFSSQAPGAFGLPFTNTP